LTHLGPGYEAAAAANITRFRNRCAGPVS
jgi:hypothetical protein